MRGRFRQTAFAAVAACVVAIGVPVAASGRGGHGSERGHHQGQIKHVLLISVDGMHQSDLDWYVANHPDSELARLAGGGAEYTNAHTSDPSDSDPGGTALMTGGDPRATGVYYDDEYNHDLFPPGTTSCTGNPPGSPVEYDSPMDINSNSLDAGQGLTGLPGSILQMTSTPQDLLVPSRFPVDPTTCRGIPPWQYLKVNTIMNVAHDAGLVTAWSDKHPVYTSFDGPSGNGITDSFDPEIDSIALMPNGTPYPGNISWTDSNAATKQYDNYKVEAVLNWIDGYDHQRTQKIGVPAILGMNFQTVSTAEKLISSPAVIGGPSLPGGYLPGTTTPGPLLSQALGSVDAQLGRLVDEIHAQGLANSTAIIITAKHGQSPQDPNQLTRIADGPIVTAINNAWTAAHPGAGPLIVYGTDDDLWQSYLSVKTQAAADFVKNYLWTHPATGVTYSGAPRTLQHSGLAQIYAGREAADFFGVPVSDPRHPDVFGRVQIGVVYTTGTKIAEHGGDNPADRDVPLLVYAPGAVSRSQSARWVETTQVAPTILRLLGLDPDALQAVQTERTQVLPGVGGYDYGKERHAIKR
jgi:hypothetical protein